ncbi:MAG TPA: phage tail tape measure protein [Candidatus Paceibacterota bacterium]|nr:phage tail tape measure protein [Candidatus Paceibacterota bacterium]
MANLGNLIAVIDANTKPFNKAMNNMNRTLNRSMKNVDKIGRGMSMAFSAPIALLAGKGVQVFKDFEFQMAKVKAVSGATASEFAKLEDNAKTLGATTRFTASEVAMLQTEYAKLGFSADEITKVTGATLALAQATDSDLARAAEVAGSTLRAFGMDASETNRVADVMAASFSSTALDMETFAESMKFVAPVAKSAGISIEDTTAMLGTLANAGIKGSQAGTALRRIISDLGATGGDVQGSIKALAAEGLNLADAKDEVGRTAQSALLVLSEGTKTTDELGKSLLGASGAAQRMADTMDDTTEGSFKKMQSAIEGMQLTIGEALAPIVSDLADVVSEAANKFTNMSEGGQRFVMIAGAIVAAIGPALLAFSQMIRAFGTIATVIKSGVIPALKSMIKLIVANPYLAAAAAIGMLAYAMSDYVSFTEPAAAAAEQFAEAQTMAQAEAAKNAAQVQRLAGVVKDETVAEEDRLAALQKLQNIAPEYFGQLDMEKVKMGELETAVNSYKDSLLKAAQTKVFTRQLEEAVARMEELKAEAAEGPSMMDKFAGSLLTVGGAGTAMNARLGPQVQETAALIEMLTGKLNDLSNNTDTTPVQNEIEKLKEQIRGTRMAMRGMSEDSAQYAEMEAHIESLKNKLTELQGITKPDQVQPLDTIIEKAGEATRGVGEMMDKMAKVGPSEIETNVGAPDQLEIPPVTGDKEANESLDTINEKMEMMKNAANSLGQSMGAAFGQIISGEGEVSDSMKSMAKSVVGTMLNIAKSSIIASATQSATASGPGAFAVAPLLIGAGLSLVEGLFNAMAFADGGIVSGPTLGLVGEYSGARNNPEVIAPLDKLQGMIDNSGGTQNVVVHGKIKGGDIEMAGQSGRRKLRRTR